MPLRSRRIVAAAALAGLAAITLGPLPVALLTFAHEQSLRLAELLPGMPDGRPRRGEVEAALNVVVPAAAVIVVRWAFPNVRLTAVAVLGITASVGIEAVQLALPGRHPQVRDIVLNTMGVLIGAATAWLIAAAFTIWSNRRPDPSGQ